MREQKRPELTMPSNSQGNLSNFKIGLLSVAASCGVLIVSLILQWFVYDDWLRETGPLHLVGTSIAAALTLIFVLRWLMALRKKQRETVMRFQKIAHMNDRIRNALQAIECITYATDASATKSVRDAVDMIDAVLTEVISDSTIAPNRRFQLEAPLMNVFKR